MLKKPESTVNPLQEEEKTSYTFLRRCKWVIIHWSLILVAVFISVLIMISQDISLTKEASFIFTMICVADVLATARMGPVSIALYRDDIYKDYVVRKTIRKLKVLMLLNLTCAFGVICWLWATTGNSNDSDTAKTLKKVAKWLFSVILFLGLLVVKGFVVHYYLFLKKYIPNLFSGFTVIKREEKIEEEYVPLLHKSSKNSYDDDEDNNETEGIKSVPESTMASK